MSQIREVKDATNIVEIIGERIKLDSAGINFKACCPFHNEKTPSFFVNPGLQRYRCFGCGANGDTLDFLQNFEGVTFYEALKTLADRAGIALKEFQKSKDDEEREKLIEILSFAKEYYHFLLTKHEVGEEGREYLKNRGTNAESIKIFQLGFATSAWDSLLKYLHQKKKFPLELIEKTGLIIRGRNDSYYDRFRDRLIFPLKNHRGQVVGFSGRLMNQSAKEAKYINSPETVLYHKSKMLYGYSELFREIKKKEQVIVVEGEFDMISSAQAHVNNVVAIKGSALTQDQVTLLARVAKTIILSLDADEAGVKATERAIEIVKTKALDLRVIDLKHLESLSEEDKVKDPDELARENPKIWREAVESAVSAYEFLFNHVIDLHDPKTPDGKRKIINRLAPILESIDHAVEKEFYLQKLSTALNVKESILKEDIAKFGQKKTSLSQEKTAEDESAPMAIKSYQERNEEYLMFLLFSFEPALIKERADSLKDFIFKSRGFKQVIEQLLSYKGTFDLQKFASSLAEDLKRSLMDALLNPEYEKNAKENDLDKEWKAALSRVKKESLRDEIVLINQEISNLDTSLKRTEEEEKKLDQLLTLIVQKQALIKKLG
ncbi:MAG: primase protein [Candidatus Pacebacteria bacterium GW2011_GWF2_38_9]|nr:MAG: primase, catalytic core protein [candidate division TM6 bacterium GW2011_GWF2_28_16]KKQ07523.1 MAG: primase protein [Candidatus Pacebacteria bacterium GW2011_GWF1_36_5]KKQ88749.1 MAG: primase protein [Candidatus Pacebacteria bacterium GW2011_GWF2_38_9]HAZ73719.1 DNA primase [Candidatus Paceibacterota bacterium]